MPSNNPTEQTSTLSKPVFVIDTGGTTTRMAIWDGRQLLEHRKFNTPNYRQEDLRNKTVLQLQEAWINFINNQLEYYRERFPNIGHISIGFAGPIPEDGTITYAPNIWGESSHPLYRSQLESKFKLPVTIVNDMTAAIYRYGKASRYSNCRRISLITISTGIGSKLFDIGQGKVIMDEKGRVGEIGHATIASPHIFLKGKPLQGQLEHYASGRGTAELCSLMGSDSNYSDLYHDSLLHQAILAHNTTLGKIDKNLLAPLILENAKAGDPFSLQVLRESIHLFAYVLHIVILSSAPDKIILMGGFAQNGGELYRKILIEELTAINVHGYSHQELDTMVEFGINDDYNGLIGAGLMVLDRQDTPS
ncbi:MAG: ROK family protein [Chlamydiota bacterium]